MVGELDDGLLQHEVVLRPGRLRGRGPWTAWSTAPASPREGACSTPRLSLFDQHVAVNTRGPFFLMQAAVQDMLRRGSGRSIVDVLTMSSHGGQPHLAPYVASKVAMVGLTSNAAYAHRYDRFRVNGVNIGWIETEGEDAVERQFHDAEDGWAARASATLPMGTGTGRRDRGPRRLPAVSAQRRGDRLGHRLGPDSPGRQRLRRGTPSPDRKAPPCASD